MKRITFAWFIHLIKENNKRRTRRISLFIRYKFICFISSSHQTHSSLSSLSPPPLTTRTNNVDWHFLKVDRRWLTATRKRRTSESTSWSPLSNCTTNSLNINLSSRWTIFSITDRIACSVSITRISRTTSWEFVLSRRDVWWKIDGLIKVVFDEALTTFKGSIPLFRLAMFHKYCLTDYNKIVSVISLLL